MPEPPSDETILLSAATRKLAYYRKWQTHHRILMRSLQLLTIAFVVAIAFVGFLNTPSVPGWLVPLLGMLGSATGHVAAALNPKEQYLSYLKAAERLEQEIRGFEVSAGGYRSDETKRVDLLDRRMRAINAAHLDAWTSALDYGASNPQVDAMTSK